MSDKQKELYENLDFIAEKSGVVVTDALAEVIFTVTGSDMQSRLDPDARDAARGTCLRWLRDHGYLERTPRGYRAPRQG